MATASLHEVYCKIEQTWSRSFLLDVGLPTFKDFEGFSQQHLSESCGLKRLVALLHDARNDDTVRYPLKIMPNRIRDHYKVGSKSWGAVRALLAEPSKSKKARYYLYEGYCPNCSTLATYNASDNASPIRAICSNRECSASVTLAQCTAQE